MNHQGIMSASLIAILSTTILNKLQTHLTLQYSFYGTIVDLSSLFALGGISVHIVYKAAQFSLTAHKVSVSGLKHWIGLCQDWVHFRGNYF